MIDITTLHSFDTEYSADSIEWCPHPEYLDYFVCGTYQLIGAEKSDSNSPPGRRKGRIYLFKYEIQSDRLCEVFRLETAAILDMKWLYEDNWSEQPILAVANALGDVVVYTLKNDEIEKVASINLNPDDYHLIALSLDWEWKSQGAKHIVASDSIGFVTILSYGEAGLIKLSSIQAHSFEAWICAYDKWNPNRIFTGGDDTFMHSYDVSAIESPVKEQTIEDHLAGVTCFLSHPTKENIFLTGSYDEAVRLFDTRNMKKCLAKINVGGGVWRLKADPKDGNLILCACMYENFSIVKLTEDCSELELAAVYKEHESICYGSDWCLSKELNEYLVMATCSFYDNKLCVSRVVEQKY